MKRVFFSGVLLFLLLHFGCSGHSSPGAGGTAKLTLTSHPRQGFAPLRVTLHAVLQGVSEIDVEYYCLREKWDFGDGTVSSEQPNCEVFGSGSKVILEFIMEHVYEEKGSFTAFLTLGDKKLRSNNALVYVLENPLDQR